MFRAATPAESAPRPYRRPPADPILKFTPSSGRSECQRSGVSPRQLQPAATVNKKQLADSIIQQLATEMEFIATTAKTAHDEATHDEDLHKNQFDTPGLETSVLAEGQVKVAAELREARDAFRSLEPKDFAPGEAIALGALVETETAGEKNLYFVGPKAGGLEVEFDDATVYVITPHSPIGARLIGRRAGDAVTTAIGRPPLQIVSVQ